MSKALIRIVPLLITLVTTCVAVVLGWTMWNTYMGKPWTRDGTVRSYVVTMAPEVAGRIVELPVQDNEFVHRGDLLLVIDPTDYTIAVRLAEAAVRQAQANAHTIDAQIAVQQAQINASEAQVEGAQAAVTFAQEQAARYEDLAKREFGTVQMAQETASTLRKDEATLKNTQAALTLAQRQIETLKAQRSNAEATIAQAVATRDQAKVNLERTQIRSPVNGWVTNLLARRGDYATVGKSVISLVDADSFWVDAYFEETQLASIARRRFRQGQVDGLQPDRSRRGRQRRAGHQRLECATQPAGAGHRQPDLHLGAAGPTRAGAHPDQGASRWCSPCRRHDRHGRGRAPTAVRLIGNILGVWDRFRLRRRSYPGHYCKA